MERNDCTFFSVIVPVYNVCEYLDACIESVIGQTYKDFELILIDDGSNDGSELICDKYSNEYDNVVVAHKANGGQSSARNRGVEISRGQYFIFVDSDDYIAPNTLEMFCDKITIHGELDVILSERMYNVEPDGNVIDIQRHLNCSDFEGVNGEQALLMMGMEWSPCGKCFRTAFWRAKRFRFIEGIISEDFQLIDRVTLEAQKVAMVTAHYYYRWKIQSSTMHLNYGKLVRDTTYVIGDWDAYLKTLTISNQLDKSIKNTLANMFEHTVMGNLFYADPVEIDELIDGIKRILYILKYDSSVEGKLIACATRILGVKKTCFLLNRLKTFRKRKL